VSELRSGATSWSAEGPDAYALRVRGKLDSETIGWIVEQTLATLAGGRPVYLLCDMTGYEGVTRAGRKLVGERSLEAVPRAMAIFGVSFTLRISIEMIVRAALLLSRKSLRVRFFDNEAEARAWLAEVRRQDESGAR
jgi:hypothetical protein